MTDKPTLGEEFGLNARQEDFVYEYLVDLNATQAAIRAGYSEKTAAEMGYENLRKPKIANAVAALRKERTDRYEISAENVLKEYMKLAMSNMSDYVDTDGDLPRIDFEGLTRDQLAAVSEITVDTRYEHEMVNGERNCTGTIDKVKFKLYDKTKNLDAVAKHLGLFEKDNAQSAPTIVINGRAADL